MAIKNCRPRCRQDDLFVCEEVLHGDQVHCDLQYGSKQKPMSASLKGGCNPQILVHVLLTFRCYYMKQDGKKFIKKVFAKKVGRVSSDKLSRTTQNIERHISCLHRRSEAKARGDDDR